MTIFRDDSSFPLRSSHITGWGDALGVWGPERVSVPVKPFVEWNEWWSYFDIVAQMEQPPSAAALAVGKLAVNQFMVIPLLYMPLFFAFTGALGGLDVKQSFARAQSLYFPLLRRNYFFWLPVQFFQFFVLAPEWQIPFVSVSSLVWTVILSSIGGSSQPPASPSTIVSYDVQQTDNEEVVTVVAVDGGPVNDVRDDVLLEDVENALIPESVNNALSNDKVVAGVQGGLLALLASAADDATLGAVLSEMFDGEIGLGVTLLTLAGAGLGRGANQPSRQCRATCRGGAGITGERCRLQMLQYARGN